ncbi:hypothetical protein [Aquisalimonas asiatica]|uniref:Uncharacterized protein n=1 Tax=Aquisalimonas asiatica TaxID=406100 RepID=A0A1H8TR24_9GAMM|nr:hypothetical protein [Aquisalimonas asiatica]SEO93480.1 hypothetical protein SAMN04488052_104409 [Aquisalimonas asiatica]
MSATDANRPDNGGETERLRRELAAVRQRLEDEVAYYRGQVETTRQRVESEHLRAQAREVARRRQLEEELSRAKTELRELREQSERLQRRYETLNQQYLQQEESARSSAEEQLAQTRAAARSAWQSAEEELAAMEADLAQARRALAEEQERARQLEETVASLQGLDDTGGSDHESTLLDEIAALKKALNLSERSREHANKRTVRLAEKLVAIQAERRLRDETESAEPAATGGASRFGAGNPVPVDLSEANAVLSASQAAESAGDDVGAVVPASARSLEADLADEFRVIQADRSLDRSRLERLEQQVREQEREDVRRERERRARQPGASSPPVADPPEPDSTPRARPGPPAASPAPAAEDAPVRPRRWPSVLALVVLIGLLGTGSAWFFGVLP